MSLRILGRSSSDGHGGDVSKAPPRYAAFLSYSRSSDSELSAALRDALQQFTKPWNRFRALRIFRDDANLAANPGLWSAITTALDSSEYMILLASPDAADSPWVDREVAYWLTRNDTTRILLAVSAGVLRWDSDKVAFDPAGTNCIPPALMDSFEEEPRWTDLRGVRDFPDLSLRVPAFRDKVADLAAPLHHIAKDELIGADVVQHRRTRRLIRTTVATLATLALLAAAAAVVAVNMASVATREARAALVNGLISQSGAQRNTDPATALRLALAAFTAQPSASTRANLVDLLVHSRFAGEIYRYAGEVRGMVSGDNGRNVIVGGGDAPSVVLGIADPGTVQLLSTLGHPKGRGWNTGSTYAIAGNLDDHIVLDGNTVWDLTDPLHPQPLAALERREERDEFPTWTVAYSATRRLALAGGGFPGAPSTSRGIAAIWDLREPRRPVRLGELRDHTGPVWSAAFTHEGGTVITGSDSRSATIWDVRDARNPRRVGNMPGHPGPVWVVAASPDGRTVLTGSGAGTAILWDLHERTSPRRMATLSGHMGNVWTAAFSPDSRQLLTGSESDNTASLWNIENVSQPHRIDNIEHSAPVSVAIFGAAGRTMITSTLDGTVRMWTARHPGSVQAKPIERIPPNIGIVYDEAAALAIADYVRPDRPELFRLADGKATSLSHIGGADIVVGLSADGSVLLTRTFGPAQDSLVVWDTRDPMQPRRAYGFAGDNAILSRDGTMLGIEGARGQLELFGIANPYSPQKLGTISVPAGGHSGDMQFSPDNHIVVDPGSYESQLWDMTNARAPRRLGTIPGTSIAFSRDGHYLIAGTEISRTRIWDVGVPSQPVGRGYLDGAVRALSADGRLAVTFEIKNTYLWDLTYPDQPSRVAAIGGYDATAILSDGRTLVAGGYEGNPTLLDITPLVTILVEPLDGACSIVGRGLTSTEWEQYAPGLAYVDSCK